MQHKDYEERRKEVKTVDKYKKIEKKLFQAAENLDKYIKKMNVKILPLSPSHGFLAAVAISPTIVLPSRWLPFIFGSKNGKMPEFNTQSEEDLEDMLGSVFEIYNCVLESIREGALVPFYCVENKLGKEYRDFSHWSTGFLLGAMGFDDINWGVPGDRELTEMFLPIFYACENNQICNKLYTREQVESVKSREDELGELIADAFWDIKDYLEEEAVPDLMPFPSFLTEDTEGLEQSEKIGRNAPCPCGSGKKYKKCCGK